MSSSPPAGSFPTTTCRLSGRPASPRCSARGRRSPKSPNFSAPTHGRAISVADRPDRPDRPDRTPVDPATRAAELCDAALAGDRRALARLLTAVENRTLIAEAALRILYPKAGRAHLVGITGPPGAGKSTLVATLIALVRAAGRSVAVIA